MSATKNTLHHNLADRAKAITQRELRTYAERTVGSQAANARARKVLPLGVPSSFQAYDPHPLVLRRAQNCTIEDIDGNLLDDFCLGDTGSMFGHSPPAVTKAIRAQAGKGLTYMLPTTDAVEVGQLLCTVFGDMLWQIATTATDANRFALRVARAGAGEDRIRKRLFESEAILCAGPETAISGPASLTDLLYIRPPELPAELIFRQGENLVRATPVRQMIVNHAGLVRVLLRFGGFAFFPAFAVAEALSRGDLVRILPDCDFGPVEVQVLYTARRARLSNAKHFTDALVAFLEGI